MRSAVIFIALAGFLAAEIAMAGEIVGVAKRVRGAAELIAAEGRDKLLAPGDRVAMNDIVATGRNGSALLQLLDASVFTIGPDARIRIDRFVYDPDRGGGESTISFLSGAIRFVSGRISGDAPGAMRLVTPQGTIGVRGTDAAIQVSPGGATSIILLDPGDAPPGGALVVTTDAGEAVLSAAGDGLRLTAPGAPPIVRRWTEEAVNDLLGAVGPGQRWSLPDRADAPDDAVILTAAQCATLGQRAAAGAEYVPGQDVYGRPVTPAITGGAAGQDFTIALTIDALRAAGVVPPVAGIEGQTRLGEIRIEGGRAWLDGALLNPQETGGLRRLCRENLTRGGASGRD